MLALGALDRDLPERLPYFFSDGTPRIHLARKVHMGDILLWPWLGFCLSSPRLQYLQSDREKFSIIAFPLGMRWTIGMSLDARELYSSPNGDRWYLAPVQGKYSSCINPMPLQEAAQLASKSGISFVEEVMVPNTGSYCA